MKIIKSFILLTFTLHFSIFSYTQGSDEESLYYKISTVPIPEEIHLECGGVESLPDGSIAVCTRRGDVWIINNPTSEEGKLPELKLFATGLHEPLGLIFNNGSFYTAQRGELTKITDLNDDRIADEYETIYSWPLSSNYHEYSFGPVLAEDGSYFVFLNVGFEQKEWWRGVSIVPWRGWTLNITEDGKMTPWATGMRSPAGYGYFDGELFYADNQGDWIGSGALWNLPKGAFTANPAGLKWTNYGNSSISLTEDKFYSIIDKRQEIENGGFIKPENIENEENPDFLYSTKEKIPEIQIPAVILPHGILGISISEIVMENNGGNFGPFDGQLLIGDQGQSKIMRVFLERIDGKFQGVAFNFRSGFQSGILRMDWDANHRLFIGQTNRGWGSAGTTNSGLQYLTWTGVTPFEMKTVKVKPDGFEIEFTKPIDRESAEDLISYDGKSYTYKYHPVYGSPQTDIQPTEVVGVKVSQDGLKVRLVLKELRQHFIHEFNLEGIKAEADGSGLLHPRFYYTLNSIPEGPKLLLEELSQKKTIPKKVTSPIRNKGSLKSPSSQENLSYEKIVPILQKNTCLACHHQTNRLIGPAFLAISKRKYTNDEIVNLIYNPQPKNWPEYATPMAPMTQVPKNEALKIAAYINSLRKE